MADDLHSRDLIYNYVFHSGFYSKYHVAIINPLGPIFIEGLTSDQPIQLAFSVQYGGNQAAQAVNSAIEAGTEAVTGMANKALSKRGSKVQIPAGAVNAGVGVARQGMGYGSENVLDTISKFETSQSTPLTVDIFVMKEFIPGKSYDKLIEDSLRLSTPNEITSSLMIESPLKYAPDDSAGKNAVSTANTSTIVIGEQLEITHMICENFTYSPSVQVREDGSPVYLKCTYSFRTGRALDWKEYKSWFKKL